MDKIVCIGVVTDVNAETHTARVIYPESGMTSDWLAVLQHGTIFMPQIGDVVVVIYVSAQNADGFILGVTT